ncbi:MAG: hypothetical protein OK452_06605 [Thaumarchaeota archaeon]|nr:hypothetical protein [Nitrososphaerota archaeon]
MNLPTRQVQNAAAIVYSVVVMATIIPGIASVSNLIVVPYFLVVPGYYADLLVHRSSTFIERTFYSVAWSSTLLAAMVAIKSLDYSYQPVPIDVIIPSIAIIFLAFDVVKERREVEK